VGEGVVVCRVGETWGSWLRGSAGKGSSGGVRDD